MEELQPTAEMAQPMVVQLQNKNLCNLAFLQSKERKIVNKESFTVDPFDPRKIIKGSEKEQYVANIELQDFSQFWALASDSQYSYILNEETRANGYKNEKELFLANISHISLLQAINYSFITLGLRFYTVIDAFLFCKNINESNFANFIKSSGNTLQQALFQKEALKVLKTWRFGGLLIEVNDILHVPTSENITEDFVKSFPKDYLLI